MLNALLYTFILYHIVFLLICDAFMCVHCIVFYSSATEALINNNNKIIGYIIPSRINFQTIVNAPTLIQLKTPAKKTSGNYIKKNDSICYQRFNHANHQTTYATAQIRVTLVIHSTTVNASINVHNCFLFTTLKCFIMLYKFIIILVSSCLEFLVCTRCLITSNTRASCHACANTDN